MKILISYDSKFGNTRQIAEAVAKGFSSRAKVSLKQVGDVDPTALNSYDYLIVGSPVHAGRASQPTLDMLEKIPQDGLRGVKVSAFDTRISSGDVGFGLKILMKVIAYAAEKIAKSLTSKGGSLVLDPAGFYVEGKEGPLKKGELERAKAWPKQLKI